ncbi:hypothetical protein Cfor_06630 [Coptotermes formosanus]|uniref:28S ribosomal protein S18c, mitochondrial n=1 Tax=Coptotermes formosanus TaxID=36987 RepID=A0A6L2Q6N2_COPFO|nr:hypothetical protein Cfor_06630 [Coptotermes formosanus]
MRKDMSVIYGRTCTSFAGKLQYSLPYMRGTSRNLATLGGGEVWRSKVKPQSELNEDIQNARLKDMPVQSMQNPFEREKTQCILCQYKIVPDYKNVKLLSQFVSPYTGRIYGRHITRLCATQQARLEKEIMKSQAAGFMPYYFKDVAFVKDPKLFDPDHPIRPHRF